MNSVRPQSRFSLRALRKSVVISLSFFLISALVGALISYSPSLAWPRFALIAVGLALFILLSLLIEPTVKIPSFVSWPSLLFAILPTLLILYFALTDDWAARIGKLSWLDPALRVLSSFAPVLTGIRIDSHSLEGMLAELLPLQIAALFASGNSYKWLGIVLLSFSLVGLLLGESRSSWFALAAVGGLGALWVLSGPFTRRWSGDRQHRIRIAIVATVIVLVALTVLAIALTPFGQALLQRRTDRLAVWQNSLDLASDYAFTGLGLGGFDMAYSSYVLLLHVGHTVHAHNLYLDVWLEQGLIGLFALVGLVIFSIQPAISSLAHARPLSVWQVASLASLGVVLVYGMVDDPFYGYGGFAIPFLFIPFALIARRDEAEETPPEASSLRFPLIFVVAVLVLLVPVLLPGIRAALIANIGALSQTRAELSIYEWPAWPIQDEVRRVHSNDLSEAISLYRSALAVDTQNATANRRLGQIELSLGEYDQAQRHLRAAYASGPNQRATRQMLGEIYAISGDSKNAALLLNSVDVSDGQLGVRAWWYEHIGEPQHATLLKSTRGIGE
jgi:tetratricopeptide (TPR) repeat protein